MQCNIIYDSKVYYSILCYTYTTQRLVTAKYLGLAASDLERLGKDTRTRYAEAIDDTVPRLAAQARRHSLVQLCYTLV